MTKRNPSSVPFAERLTCTVREAEGYTGFGNTKIWELIDDGRLESIKVDGTRLIYVRSVLKLLNIAVPAQTEPGLPT